MDDEPVTTGSAGWLDGVAARSDMGRRVAGFDWSSTPLGPTGDWPSELRAAVSTCLSTRFPMLVVWGPELIEIYNDAYGEILGEKHPAALGSPTKEIWGEIWDTIGPLFRGVYETGEPTWVEDQLLVIDRKGFAEECHFTYSYSPLFDVDGVVRGVVDVVAETTGAVDSRSRLGCLADLGATLFGADEISEVCTRSVATLARWPQCLRAVDVHLCVGDELALAASTRRVGLPAVSVDLLELARPTILRSAHGGSALGGTDSDDHVGPAAEVTIPIGRSTGGRVGLLVVSPNPRRPFDDTYAEFVDLIAQVIEAAFDRAARHTAEVGEYRRIGDTLQQAMLQPASDFATVAARYLAAVGNLSVGGDWYDVVELPEDRRALVVGDCVGHGLESAAAMSQLRAAARAMLLQGLDPALTLDGLDRYAESVEGAFCATAVCVVVDRRAGTITYSRAGHPPPLVVTADGTSWLDGAASPPLAVVPDERHVNAVHELHEESVVILYSDGLIERRGESIDVGLDRLAGLAQGLFGSSVRDVADSLVDVLLPETAVDDVVVVVKQVGPPSVDLRTLAPTGGAGRSSDTGQGDTGHVP